MDKNLKALKVVSDQVARLDCTIENLNLRQGYRRPDSNHATAASFTMARMAQSGLSSEDIAYAFVLPVEDVEASIRFTENYRGQHPGSYKQLMGQTIPCTLPAFDSYEGDIASDSFDDGCDTAF